MENIKIKEEKIFIHPFKTYRRERDLTIGELAKQMGVNASGISRIERGYTPCSRKFAKAFERVSGINWLKIIALEPDIFRTVTEPRGKNPKQAKK